MATTNYFTQLTASTNAKDAPGNILLDNSAQSAVGKPGFGIKITTGVANTVTLDVCGTNILPSAPTATATEETIRVRVDTYTNDNLFINSYISPPLFMDDMSAVAAGLAATAIPGIGKKLSAAPFLPMFFHTLSGDGINSAINRSFRITLKDDEKIKNGMKLVVMAKHQSKANSVKQDDVDVSFSASTLTAPRPLVNGGPLGADEGIPPFTTTLTLKEGTTTTGVPKIFSDAPLFKNGGDGIDLKAITFRIKEDKDGGTEVFKSLSIPAAEDTETGPSPNADGKYEYTLDDVDNADGKSYRVMNTAVTDKFDVVGYAMQNSVNGAINLNNIPNGIDHDRAQGFVVDCDAIDKEGTKAKVSFAAPSTAAGPKSIKKYEARWFTQAQLAALGNVPVNFEVIKANYPDQVNVQTDICLVTGAPFTHVNLTGLSPSQLTPLLGNTVKASRYGVFVKAFTTDKDGNFIDGAQDYADISQSSFTSADTSLGTTAATGVSLGFFVSGVADAPTHVGVRVGKDIALDATASKIVQDVSMDQNLMLVYNDYGVNMRGSHYDSLRYDIIKAEDVPYATESLLIDASFATVTGNIWNGNDAAAESLTLDGSGLLRHKYNPNTRKFDSLPRLQGVDNEFKAPDLSNGDEYAIQYAFDNSNGMGFRSPWYTFIPSTMPDASASILGLDASTNTLTGANGSIFGQGASKTWAKTQNSHDYVGLDDGDKAKRLALGNINESLTWGFSLIDASGVQAKNAGKAYTSPSALDGGAPISQIRYYVNKSSNVITYNDSGLTKTENTNLVADRIYGSPHKDVSGNFTTPTAVAYAQFAPASKDTTSLTVTQGFDTAGALTSLKNGQRYDICFSLVNANGFNDASHAVLSGFAPMGSISALKNGKPGNVAAAMTGATTARLSVSYEDLSGVAEHGGYLVNRIVRKVTQFQGLLGEKEVLAEGNVDCADLTDRGGYFKKRTATEVSGLTLDVTNAKPGFPFTVTLTPVSVGSTVLTTNTVKSMNYVYNAGKDVKGPSITITVPGPKLQAGSEHDEVRSLIVDPKNGALSVGFFKPVNDGIAGDLAGAPSVNAYYIYQYDMSLSTLTGATSTTISERAMSRTVKVISDVNSLNADYFETSLPSINGKCYVIAVHTQWRYGVNNDILELSKGVYHTNITSAARTNDPSFNSDGTYTLPVDARPASGTVMTRTNCAIPRDAPKITTTNNSLVFDDNGSALTAGAVIQVAPVAATGRANAFHLDLCGSAAGNAQSAGVVNTTTTAVPVDGHATNRHIIDICSTTVLGNDWATEKNFIIVQNAAGSAYAKRNIE